MINGKVSLVNRDSDDLQLSQCQLLSAGKRIDSSNAFRLGDYRGIGDLEVIALQGIAGYTSHKTIAIECGTGHERVTSIARLTAIRVTAVRFQPAS